jgi:perosamine synthetase
VFWIIERGWKYKMSNLQAAFGLAQLERIDEMIEAKRRIFDWYDEELAGIAGVTLHREVTGTRSIHWMTSITVDDDAPLTRDELRTALRARDVDTRPVFPAISQYPYWERRQAPQPVSLWIGEHGLNLPSGVRLRRDEVAYVAGCVRELLSRARPRSAAR